MEFFYCHFQPCFLLFLSTDAGEVIFADAAPSVDGVSFAVEVVFNDGVPFEAAVL